MSLTPSVDSRVVGCFVEKTHGNRFEFIPGASEWATGHGADHSIFVSVDAMRACRLLKTVCYIIVDEDELGGPVWEKWAIRHVWTGP